MRNLIFLIMLCVYAISAIAQEQTLFTDSSEKGGFGGPVIKFTSIYGQSAVMIGGRGGWIFDHTFVIGGGAYAIANEINAPDGVMPLEGPLDIEFACFGLELEYILNTNSLVHYSLYTLIGGGAAKYVKDVGPVTQSNEQAGETSFMFVLEPAINGELNITNWFRFNAGVSYRLTSGTKPEGLKDSDFNGITATLTFKFGTF